MEERQLDGKFTKIPNDLIKGDKELDSKELTILILLYLSRNSKDICTYNLEWLYKSLNIKNTNTYGKKEIRNILQIFYKDEILIHYTDIYLKNETIIEDVTNYNKNDLIFSELYSAIDEGFTLIYDSDIKILIDYSNENKIDVYSLIKTYTYICSTFNNNVQSEDYLLGFPSLVNISDIVEITEKTALKYINIFDDLKIFVFDYAGYKETSKGQIKNGHMYYTRVGNEDLLLQKLNNERIKHGYIKINQRNKDKSNLKRSITLKIKHIKEKQEKGQANIIDIENIKLLTEQYEELIKRKEEKTENEKA
jgi:hypothetical protein